MEYLPCVCTWCAHWSEEGCFQAHNCEDFDWGEKE